MTDFSNIFWDYYIAIITVISVVGCGVFLWLQSTRKVPIQAAGQASSTTGHVWDDDLQEFHNPLPRWWMWLFYLTIVFALAYLVLFPGLGTQFKGSLGWSSEGELSADVQADRTKYDPLFESYLKQPLQQLVNDERAHQIGERIFLNNCAQCHGADARGSRGFPNLADSEWLYGSTPETIKTTIAQGRQGLMPPMAEAVGGGENVTDVAHYVLSLSSSAHDPVRAIRGKANFAACAGCHGADAKGNQQIGAPDLTNRLWTYGGSVATISETISKGRHGVMPAWKGVLSDAQIHLVAAYVVSASRNQ